ncbi:MAG TPA: helix-turn-helix transcriptional regulator [Symbiobacteriaceae bacterium]|nr:helix-turn-helix transcriptional regulator [Symbiobacteriaceae bacterium]
MQIGRRVAKLRASHGESLREASIRTGVSHTTIARIEKGEVSGSFHSTLKKVADGYGVRVEFLLTGRDPRQSFEEALQRLSSGERSRLYFLTPHARTQMVLDFLATEFAHDFSWERVIRNAGLSFSNGATLLQHWQASRLTEEEQQRLSKSLAKLTGIPLSWFQAGVIDQEAEPPMPEEWAPAYAALIRRAAAAQIPPHMLSIALDLLMLKHAEAAPAQM